MLREVRVEKTEIFARPVSWAVSFIVSLGHPSAAIYSISLFPLVKFSSRSPLCNEIEIPKMKSAVPILCPQKQEEKLQSYESFEMTSEYILNHCQESILHIIQQLS